MNQFKLSKFTISPIILKIARRTTGAKGYFFLAIFLQAYNKSLKVSQTYLKSI